MKNIAFTICAKNYIGLAQVLEKSIKSHNPEVDFYIFIADEINLDDAITDLPKNVFVTRNVVGFSDDKWNQMAFKYDLTEFCTSIKPSCFKYLFDKFQPDTCIYFDPDILVFNSLNSIFSGLESHSIIVTPHITTIEENYTGDLPESGLMYTGMFNLGFLGLKRNDVSMKMLNWWEKRLEDRCFQNKMESYFTDQKWMDFLPSLFSSELLISFDLGLNFAPWNFYEREVIMNKNLYYVRNRINKNNSSELTPLTFVHFSGFNYSSLVNNEIAQGNIAGLKIYPDVEQILNEYSKVLKESSFLSFIKLTYTYGKFSDGKPVSKTYRKLFRRLFEDGQIKSNPFDAKGQFYQALKAGNVLNEKMSGADKKSVNNFEGVNRKLTVINKIFYYAFKVLGAERFFMLVRLLRIYSKVENHVYLIDGNYLDGSKIRD
ncbi:hypothetical protein BB050_02173 [Flavobacterium anhuiense]|uniref:Glycosyl transferase n=1 Tax=Flavobacterium anhuiense TaxID=459526 RepID=A0AAC9D288_9FLAO|nr:hypothetical protein [Flavobacterium anhuiense]AOC95289.1 hypothetical protein BB050_02173 [Flavobacterium anhuiense]